MFYKVSCTMQCHSLRSTTEIFPLDVHVNTLYATHCAACLTLKQLSEAQQQCESERAAHEAQAAAAAAQSAAALQQLRTESKAQQDSLTAQLRTLQVVVVQLLLAILTIHDTVTSIHQRDDGMPQSCAVYSSRVRCCS